MPSQQNFCGRIKITLKKEQSFKTFIKQGTCAQVAYSLKLVNTVNIIKHTLKSSQISFQSNLNWHLFNFIEMIEAIMIVMLHKVHIQINKPLKQVLQKHLVHTIIDISPRIFILMYCCCVSIIIVICIVVVYQP